MLENSEPITSVLSGGVVVRLLVVFLLPRVVRAPYLLPPLVPSLELPQPPLLPPPLAALVQGGQREVPQGQQELLHWAQRVPPSFAALNRVCLRGDDKKQIYTSVVNRDFY